MAPKDEHDNDADAQPFTISREMRHGYLERRLGELGELKRQAEAGEWKRMSRLVHNIRGSAAMYGFPEIGDAAAFLDSAIQEGLDRRRDAFDQYLDAVAAAGA